MKDRMRLLKPDQGTMTIEFVFLVPFILVIFFFLIDVMNLFYLNSKIAEASTKLALWTSSDLTKNGRPLSHDHMQDLLRAAAQGALPAAIEAKGEISVSTHESVPRRQNRLLWSSRSETLFSEGEREHPFPPSHYRTTHLCMGFVTVSITYPYHPLQGIFSFSISPFLIRKDAICVYRRHS